MLASLWEPILAGALIVLTLCVVGAGLTAFLLFRYGRRKWRAFHSHGAVVGAVALWEATAPGLRGRGAGVPEDVYHGDHAQVRKELWRSSRPG